MDQKIFEIGLPVETVSLYLLCCSLADADTVISTRNLIEIWNGTEKALVQGLKELEEKYILHRHITDDTGDPAYRLIASANWKK